MLQFTDNEVGKVEVLEQQIITERDIEGIMVGAIEGGINYWADINRVSVDWANKPKEEPVSTWATKLLLDGKSVHFLNEEEPSENIEPLTLTRLLAGIRKNAEKRPFDADLENGDAITCDCIVQYAVFNELVYG
jgi:hypothetical protein